MTMDTFSIGAASKAVVSVSPAAIREASRTWALQIKG